MRKLINVEGVVEVTAIEDGRVYIRRSVTNKHFQK